MREADKSLEDILTLGRTLEMADSQAAIIERDEKEAINRVKSNPKSFRKHPKTPKEPKMSKEKRNPMTCRYCGGEYPHANKCPALGKTCNYCKKKNHFKSMCRKLKYKQVKQVSTESDKESSSEDEYCYGVKVVGKIKGSSSPSVKLKLNDTNCQMLIDTGASVNILDEHTHKSIGAPKLNRKVDQK